MTRSRAESQTTAIEDVRPGDWVDLEGDAYGDNASAYFEWAVVEKTEQLDLEHWMVYTSQGAFKVPYDHALSKRTEWPSKPSGLPGPLM